MAATLRARREDRIISGRAFRPPGSGSSLVIAAATRTVSYGEIGPQALTSAPPRAFLLTLKETKCTSLSSPSPRFY